MDIEFGIATSDALDEVVGGFAPEDGLGAMPAPLTAAFAAASGFAGKRDEVLHGADASGRPLTVAGVGAPGEVDAAVLCRAAAILGPSLAHASRARVVIPASVARRVGAAVAARAVVEGIALGTYRFDAHKTHDRSSPLASVRIEIEGAAGTVAGTDAGAGIALGAVVARAVCDARDLANETPNRLDAVRLAEIASQVAARERLHVSIWDEAAIEEGKLGCLLAVNAGSEEPPRVIELEYEPDGADASTPTVALVGKGITFDSGGLSLKRPEHMYEMKGDMGGAAAVISVLGACRALGVSVRVVGIIAATDNLPGPTATKPGEVVTARNGTTVEILDTDAEGRLVLADALSLAAERTPAAIVDIATLTGLRTLGTHFTGVMGSAELVPRVLAAFGAAGEPRVAAAAPRRLPQVHRFDGGRPAQHRRSRCGRLAAGRAVPPGVHCGPAVGPPRHRRGRILGSRRRPRPQGLHRCFGAGAL